MSIVTAAQHIVDGDPAADITDPDLDLIRTFIQAEYWLRRGAENKVAKIAWLQTQIDALQDRIDELT